MYSGWFQPFPHGERVSESEQGRQLFRDRAYAHSDNHGSLIRFNATFIELIDRRFRQRGMVLTLASSFAVALLLCFWAWAAVKWGLSDRQGRSRLGTQLFFAGMFGGGAALICYLFLLKDFFTFVYYPIRFNRKTRMVHAFFGGREGDVVSVPWEAAFFHIGHSHGDESFLRDLRCHVRAADGRILRTFAVGHYFDDDRKIEDLWEFVRRFMEQGPEDVFEDPTEKARAVAPDLQVPRRRIDLSVKTSWRNCFDWVVMAMPASWFDARHALSPLYAPLALCRWLVFKTCRPPAWPAAIEAESRIEEGDPFQLKEPAVHAGWGPRADLCEERR
jgi:hypothetical protein